MTAYNFSNIPDGAYTLRLHLADEYANRTMTYIAEGDTILKNYDIVTEVGKSKALVKDFTVEVTDGNGLQLECQGHGNDVFECGLEIIGFSMQKPPVRVISPNGDEGYEAGQTLTVRWESADPSSFYVVQLSVDGGLSWHDISDEGGAAGGSFEWVIEAALYDAGGGEVSTTSSDCLVKLYDYSKTSAADVSDAPFRIGVGEFADHTPGRRAPRCFSVQRAVRGPLAVSIGETKLYSVYIVRPDGSIVRAYSGTGPARHLVDRRCIPSGLYLIGARVGARQYKRKISVAK
jgi:hypothetical protein